MLSHNERFIAIMEKSLMKAGKWINSIAKKCGVYKKILVELRGLEPLTSTLPV